MDDWVSVIDPYHHGGMWVGYLGVSVLCVGMLSGSCWRCSGLVSGLVCLCLVGLLGYGMWWLGG